ncbi:MAG: carboxyl-terminal processing protease [Acidobacteriota bacterium]|jgi:carboxyl-terminal processing protease|nr:carboxyl-terminal processing protease [Acidobacteriota bacterium]
MNRSRIVFFLLSAILVFPLLAATLLRAADTGPAKKPEDDSFYKYLAVFSETLGLVRQAYVDEPDMNTLMSGALDGTTDALDPFSLYVPASQVSGYLQANTVGKRYSGLTLLKERGIAFVVAVEKGSPGDKAAIKPGDIVAKMNNRSTRLMPLWEMQEVLAGQPGSKVTMELIRVGEPVQVAFDLKPFEAPPVSLEQVDGVPLLRIPTFDDKTADAVRDALKKNGDKVKDKLLIDLRGVSAGDAESAYATARLFTTGDMGALKRRAEELQVFKSDDRPLWQGKTVILVDRGTLGASEVFATVMRQKQKAELVGERTFGHAGRQGSADLSSGGRLLFTEAFYTGPDKKPLNEALKPDLLVDERSRTYLEKDTPMSELILRRGIRRLLGQEPETEAKAA